jgi:hypothetical protein
MARRFAVVPAATLVLLAACQDAHPPIGASSLIEPSASVTAAPPPAPLVSVAAAGTSLTFWPYTGTSFDGERSDPINLVFVGEADPLSIREALFALDGNRTALGFPAQAPFNCTWRDAIGGEQTGYSAASAWEGSVLQLECGDYSGIRFHVRLFPAGEWTLANAHVDLLIPGTTDHQVLSWELAEQLVAADFVRAVQRFPGLLGAMPAPSAPIHQAPFREIPAMIYNLLPPPLRQLAGGPQTNVTAGVPIQTDGRATVIDLRRSIEPTAGVVTQEFEIPFNQTIPKPFCNPGDAFVRAVGPVAFSQEVRVSASGNLQRQWTARGALDVTSVNPFTGAPIGPTERADVVDRGNVHTNRQVRQVDYSRRQQLNTTAGSPQRLTVDLKVGPNGLTRFRRDERC